MDINGVLETVLAGAAIVLVGLAIYALVVLIPTVRELRVAVEDVRCRLVPLLDKADVSVDALNAELLRVDAIVTQVEEVGEVVSTASSFIRSPVNTTAHGVARLVRAFGKR